MIGKADTWEAFVERMVERAAEGKPSNNAKILYGGRWAQIMDMIRAGKKDKEIMNAVKGLDSNTLSVYRKAAAGKLSKLSVQDCAKRKYEKAQSTQRSIMRRREAGMTAEEIARDLHLSVRTIREITGGM